eukprot:XP_001698521.1 predicted protein [Chlamydomonas reinhardtii]
MASAPAGGTAADLADALLGQEALLFSRKFTKEKAGDHVNEVTFDFPVTVTRIVLSDPDGEAAAAAGAAGGEAAKPPQPPLLRAFARDLAHPSSCRFAALYASNMSVGGEQGGSSSSFATEPVVTDHVILRGRYTSVSVQLYGRTDQDPLAAPAEAGSEEAGKRTWPEGSMAPAPDLMPPGSSLLPLEGVPPALLSALRQAAEYFKEVGRSHSRISGNPPAGRLAPLMAAAKALLAGGRCNRLEEVNVGVAGVAAAVLLAVCAPTAPLLLAAGGAGHVMAALRLPHPPADLVRLAVAVADGLTLTCPGPAAEAGKLAAAAPGVGDNPLPDAASRTTGAAASAIHAVKQLSAIAAAMPDLAEAQQAAAYTSSHLSANLMSLLAGLRMLLVPLLSTPAVLPARVPVRQRAAAGGGARHAAERAGGLAAHRGGPKLLSALGVDVEQARRTARELQGRAEAGQVLAGGGGLPALLRLLDEGLPRLGALAILERAVRTGTSALRATASDSAWAFAAADRAHLGFGVILTAAAAAEDASATPPPPEGREPSSTALAPEAAYCLMVLLGDVFPREWPPPASPAAQQQGLQPAAFPPPSHMARRSALASALESVSPQFLRLLAFAYGSEARMLRCAAVRCVVRGAGLGGGMPGFLVAPLVEALAAIVRGAGAQPGAAALPGSPPVALTDARRLFDLLVPLAYKPTLKAVVVAGQALDALRMLLDPDLSLAPSAPREQRLREDVPPLTESAALVTALLAVLPFLGPHNAALAAQLLALNERFGLAGYPLGRAALRQGAAKVHSAQGGGSISGSELARQALLSDPAKLRALMASNPALAAVISPLLQQQHR